MAIDSDTLQGIKRKKFEDVESTWVSRLESVPRDYAWFLEVAREMRGAKANAQVSDLLALLIDTLAEEESWEAAFDMISEGLALVPRQKSIREKAVEIVRKRYAHRADLEEVILTFGLETAEELGPAFSDLRDWLRFEIGAGFFLFGRGLGRVVETNLALQKVKIKFEKATPLVVRRDEARKLLTWLPPEHFMMKRLEDSPGVHQRAIAEPEEVIRELLTLFPRPLTAAEIRECMTGIVEGAQWNSWWNRAKSHPQVLSSRERKNAFYWSASSEAADLSILNEFKTAPFEKKLELARRHAKRGGAVKEEIVQRLLEELGRLAQGPAADALEIVFLLEELEGLPAAAVSPTESILRGPDAAKAIVQVRDRRYREKIYNDLPRLRPEDWAAVAREAFFDEPDFRLMSLLYELIREQGPERAAEKLVADAVFSPRKAPRAFVWVTKNALARPELRDRTNHSLVSKILDSLEGPEFKELKAPLREQFEAGGIAFAVLEKSDREGVDLLLSLVDSGAGLEDHRKTELRRAIFSKFPDIRKRVDEDAVFVTRESLEIRRGELEQLLKVEIPQNTEAIRIAREYGDLRENFEYHAARQKHELLNSRAMQLHQDLRKARIIDPGAIDAAHVSIGTRVRLEPVLGGEERYATILGPWDSDPDRGVFSYLSDFAKGLLKRSPGELVMIDGREYRIAEIQAWLKDQESAPMSKEGSAGPVS
ncbi:MAG TPA: GreA/GreB family elongation factor [bacterium]|nr:GreA/GreB family elongation factor [bacterium]